MSDSDGGLLFAVEEYRERLARLRAAMARHELDVLVTHIPENVFYLTGYRTPSVVLFGPVSPRRWGPPADRPYHRAIWHGTRSERGDLPGPVHPALLAVTEDEVLAAADQVCHEAAAQ